MHCTTNQHNVLYHKPTQCTVPQTNTMHCTTNQHNALYHKPTV